MAEACSFDESNCHLEAPEGVEEDVQPLSILRGEMKGSPVVISLYKLTAAELAEVNRTGRVSIPSRKRDG